MNSSSTQHNAFFTVEEVAEQLRVDPALIYRQIHAGQLPAYRIGGRALRVAWEDLQTYLLHQRLAPVKQGV